MIFTDAGLSDLEPFRYTQAEMNMLAALAEVRVSADAGNRRAKKQMKKLERQKVALERRARRGDTKAARKVRVLEESGLFQPSQTFTL
jgi:hypothetical protein